MFRSYNFFAVQPQSFFLAAVVGQSKKDHYAMKGICLFECLI